MNAALRWIPFALAWILVAFPTGAAAAPAGTAGPLPARGISRALLISIDGLRSDVLLRADAPVIRGLMDRGSFSMWALTTEMAVTLPSHVSMLTGVPPSVHGIVWNSDRPLAKTVYPSRPTLFELARQRGYTTAMAVGKSKLSQIARPGSLDWVCLPKESVSTDEAVADSAVQLIAEHAPEVLFVHLPSVDTAGHDSGWGSRSQLAAIAGADRCVGRMLAALAARGLLDSTLVLVTSDHGGAGTSHGANDDRSLYIPWIAAGPSVRGGSDLTEVDSLAIHTEDTFATICHLLAINVPGTITGRPVIAILAKD